MIIALIILAIALIIFIVKKYSFQVLMLMITAGPYYLWNFLAKETTAYVPLFAMEDRFFTMVSGPKFNNWMFGADSLPRDPETMLIIFVIINVLVILLSRISKWTMAAGVGYSATIAVPAIMQIINILGCDNKMPPVVIFFVTFIIMLIAMWFGFHSIYSWVMPTKDVLSLVFGIIPSLAITFIAFCNNFTMSFRGSVLDKNRYVVIAIVLSIILYATGIVLYFCFKQTYLRILGDRIEKIKEKNGIE